MAEQPPFYEIVKNKRVIVVAPGAYTQNSRMGQWVDSFDLVVRLNWGVPVPESLKVDLGSRTDILYKRLLKLGRLDSFDVDEYLTEGLAHIVAVDRAGMTQNMQHFREMVKGKIPWTLDSNTRRRLRSEFSTSPLIGMIAIRHLLDSGVKELQLFGMDFYQTGYYDGYGGREYRQSMNRKEGVIGRTHDGERQLRSLERWRQRDPRIKYDGVLQSIVENIDTRIFVKNATVVIPARAESSRFPNKPMALILGRPMILWVAEAVQKAGCEPIIATDSVEIQTTAKRAGYKAVFTSNSALTGTDRVAEAVIQLKLKDDTIIINVQGDEPLVNPNSIEKILKAKRAHMSYPIGAFYRVNEELGPDTIMGAQILDRTAVKVALGRHHKHGQDLLYASRAPIPWSSGLQWHKQVGLYAYTVAELKAFNARRAKTYNEALEDIEILRFLELGMPVIMTEVQPSRQAVDLPEHIKIVEDILNAELQLP